MIAQGFDSPKDFLTEWNNSDYFRGKKIPGADQGPSEGARIW
jgi:hypothetical protein